MPENRKVHPPVFGGKEVITTAEKGKCEYCEKDAIGYQGFGCCSPYVCLDHANRFILNLKPWEKLTSGECYFERFCIMV